jgi:type II secretory pathway pseudopilin PulG
MKQAYTETRKAISLVEMIIAIILFAALATIGLKYSKNYISTELQAMKARVAAAKEQAKQLSDAYKLYTVEYGDLNATEDLNATDSLVLTNLPVAIDEITASVTCAWDLNKSISTTYANKKAFTMTVDANKSATSDEQYCKLWNRDFNTSITELNVSDGENMGTVDGYLAANILNFCAGNTGSYTIYVTLP